MKRYSHAATFAAMPRRGPPAVRGMPLAGAQPRTHQPLPLAPNTHAPRAPCMRRGTPGRTPCMQAAHLRAALAAAHGLRTCCRYYRDRMSVPRGPCPLHVLKEAWVQGVIDENTMVWGHGLYDWLPARNIKLLLPMVLTPEGKRLLALHARMHATGQGEPWAWQGYVRTYLRKKPSRTSDTLGCRVLPHAWTRLECAANIATKTGLASRD